MVIRGGRPLRGEVAIGGYKHALTVVAAGAVAAGRRVTLRNVPMTTEVRALFAERNKAGVAVPERPTGGRLADEAR